MRKIHFLLCLVLILAVFVVRGDETIQISQGETKTLELPFVLKSYRVLPANTKVVRVEEMDSHLRIIAGSIGQATLIVNGITGEQSSYTIEVRSNLTRLQIQLQNDLDGLNELDYSINEDRIVIRGTVTKPDHWAHLQRVLPMYKDKCVSFASFAVSTDSLLDLKKRLQDAGFAFAESRESQKQGELLLTSNRDTIYISGELYSKKNIEKVEQVLSTAPIMSGDLVKKVISLTLPQAQLGVNVAFVSLSDSDNFNRTGNVNPVATFDASFLRRWLDGSSRSKTFGFSSDMAGTISLLQADMASKLLDQGVVTIPNGGKGDFKFGGSIKVPVSGLENGDLKDISFGYIVNVGGELISEDEVQIQMDGSLSEVKSISADGTIVMEENKINVDVPLKLKNTYVVAHHKKETEMTTISGVPILKDIPLIGIFFSTKTVTKEKSDILVLVSVEIQDNTIEHPDNIGVDSQEVVDRSQESTRDLVEKPFSENLEDSLDKIIR